MTGLYVEIADFAAMSESPGFLGKCATENPDSPHSAGRKMAWHQECDFLRGSSRQLRLPDIEEESPVT